MTLHRRQEGTCAMYSPICTSWQKRAGTTVVRSMFDARATCDVRRAAANQANRRKEIRSRGRNQRGDFVRWFCTRFLYVGLRRNPDFVRNFENHRQGAMAHWHPLPHCAIAAAIAVLKLLVPQPAAAALSTVIDRPCLVVAGIGSELSARLKLNLHRHFQVYHKQKRQAEKPSKVASHRRLW